MTPLKFEEEIKEKLERRVIHPSDNSWEQLDKKLTEIHTQKRNKRIRWYSIAAAIVIIMSLTTVSVYKSIDSEQTTPVLVHVDSDTEHAKESIQLVKQEVENQKSILEENRSLVVENTENKNSEVPPQNDNKLFNKEHFTANTNAQKKLNIHNDTNAVATVNDKMSTPTSDTGFLEIDSILIENKLAKVTAQIQKLQSNNNEVTDAEIHQLLLDAQREITSEKLLKPTTIDAMSLLQDVEEELDETFKQRVFEALKSGFQKVKTAVVERNNK